MLSEALGRLTDAKDQTETCCEETTLFLQVPIHSFLVSLFCYSFVRRQSLFLSFLISIVSAVYNLQEKGRKEKRKTRIEKKGEGKGERKREKKTEKQNKVQPTRFDRILRIKKSNGRLIGKHKTQTWAEPLTAEQDKWAIDQNETSIKYADGGLSSLRTRAKCKWIARWLKKRNKNESGNQRRSNWIFETIE